MYREERIDMTDYILAISTCKRENAEEISKSLLEDRYCACVNIINGVKSIYHWKNRIEMEEESILLFKTEASMEEHLKEALLRIHPYETPEFISISIESGSADYLKWISSSLH